MKAKPFVISKQLVMQAYRLVKANRGAAGVDHQSLDDFEEGLKSNLYRLWNRMSSGSYFPAPVKAVSIPKKSGGERVLGVPTVADRVAQMVVKLQIEPDIEPHFLNDSYGYRPGKSALDAVGPRYGAPQVAGAAGAPAAGVRNDRAHGGVRGVCSRRLLHAGTPSSPEGSHRHHPAVSACEVLTTPNEW